MAKTVAVKKEKVKYDFPSRFGTHKSMLVGEPDADGNVTAKDEYGEYRTNMKLVDTGLVDWNRASGKRLEGKLL